VSTSRGEVQGVDPQRIDQLDWHGATLTERLDRLRTAHRRAGQDAANRIATQADEQAMGLMLTRNRQGAIMITAGPLVLVAGMGMTDETNHRKPSRRRSHPNRQRRRAMWWS
jgi:hypothetical protein